MQVRLLETKKTLYFYFQFNSRAMRFISPNQNQLKLEIKIFDKPLLLYINLLVDYNHVFLRYINTLQ
jgi:hypothetical protein